MSANVTLGFPLVAPRTTTFKDRRMVCLPDSHFVPSAVAAGALPIRRFAIATKAVTQGEFARFAAKVGTHYFYYDATKSAVTVEGAHPLQVFLMGAALQATGQLPESSKLDALVAEYGEPSLAMFQTRGFLSGGPGTVFQIPQTPLDAAEAEQPLDTDAVWKFAAAYCFHYGCRLPTAEEWAYAKLVASDELESTDAPYLAEYNGMLATSAFHCVLPEDPLEILDLFPYADRWPKSARGSFERSYSPGGRWLCISTDTNNVVIVSQKPPRECQMQIDALAAAAGLAHYNICALGTSIDGNRY